MIRPNTYTCSLCKDESNRWEQEQCPRCKGTGRVAVQPFRWGKLAPEQIARIVRRRVIGEMIIHQKGIRPVYPPPLNIRKAVLEHIK